MKKNHAYFHLPGLFEFYSFYQVFLPLYKNHREYFYDWVEIGSIYGAPAQCLWGGGRVGFGNDDPEEIVSLMQKYGISARLTFSNSLLNETHLHDLKCNALCQLFHTGNGIKNGVIIHSDLLLQYLKNQYPNFYFVSSTTKVLTDFSMFQKELSRNEFSYVVPDFRLNHSHDRLDQLTQNEKDKVEFLVNECCWIGCTDRKACYENVSRQNMDDRVDDFVCRSPESQYGYRFSSAMRNPSFISAEQIQNIYLPMGFCNFKIEGRGLGSALLLEFLLYYMVKPQYQINVREEIYLDSMLDLF